LDIEEAEDRETFFVNMTLVARLRMLKELRWRD
jgi:hypothetical protein